ncbi:hypothetical protein [Actinomycetospora straminea]|uniref:Integral membrane protein n=1 Tax=Actinomycetospora straminea TaxID=663607 RepID=A0ABP9EAH0_9PSEU|nr:hypothetical protein [Actinomycetospora straminea]MDD7935406.1 hypothetical protein [Actinomycetospora straminea]
MTPDPAAPPRAVLLGACAGVVGVAAHGSAGGTLLVSPATVLVTLAVVLVTALLRPRRAGRLAAVLAAGQLAIHLATPTDGHAGHHGVHAAPDGGMVLAHVAVAVLVALGFAHADRALARAVRRRVTTWARRLAGPPVPSDPPRVPADPPAPTARRRHAVVTHHPRRGPPSPPEDRTPHRVPDRAATPPRSGRTPACPHRGPRPPVPAAASSPPC